MKIGIVGAGAIGGYLAARLARQGHDLTLIARGAHLAAMRDNGLRLISDDDDFTTRPALCTDDAGSVKLGGNATKPLLRALAEKYLPSEIVNAPKRGFEVPLARWMRNELNGELHERVLDPSSFATMHLRPKLV